MTAFEIIIGIVLIVFSIIIIGIVLLQEGRQSGVGAITGAADTFLDKGKARTLDALLSKWTKVVALVFFVLAFGGMLITKFLGA